jgi:TRAP-type mannitol/chloroaromatic compound transport system permease large subunit
MTLGILGSGALGSNVARALARKGITATLATRRGPESLAPLVAELGGAIQAGTVAEAASADIVLIAVRWSDLGTALSGLPAWNNRIVIDGTNPVEFLDPDSPDAKDPSNPLAAYGIKAIDPGGRSSSEVVRDMLPAIPALLAPLILIVGMLAGYFTPTEIASVTVVYTIAISALFYRQLTVRGLLAAPFETLKATSGILLIVAVAALFGWILSVEQVPQQVAGALLSVSTDPFVLLAIVNVLLVVVGMFLDSTTAILVIAPIIAKPLVAAGVDPVHLGMVVVFNLMIGLVTPPMGLALYLVSDIAKVSMRSVLREMLPFYVPLVGTLLAITYIPALTVWLPRLMIAP